MTSLDLATATYNVLMTRQNLIYWEGEVTRARRAMEWGEYENACQKCREYGYQLSDDLEIKNALEERKYQEGNGDC